MEKRRNSTRAAVILRTTIYIGTTKRVILHNTCKGPKRQTQDARVREKVTNGARNIGRGWEYPIGYVIMLRKNVVRTVKYHVLQVPCVRSIMCVMWLAQIIPDARL